MLRRNSVCAPHVEGLALVLAPPGIDAGLQFVAARQQGAVARRELGDDGFHAGPEPRRARASVPGSASCLDEGLQFGVHRQAADGNRFAHSAITPKVIELRAF